jgi:ribosomal protein L37AE/L43A
MTPIQPVELAAVQAPACPMCHTHDRSLTREALAAGAEWRCVRCGQLWNAARLATAAAYARYMHQAGSAGFPAAARTLAAPAA